MATTTRDAYGPFHKHPPVAAFNSISERCFDRYHEITNRYGWKNLTAEQHIILLMLYVAESTSYSVRLTSSWGSSLPAVSLCRDRYEQTVRFSYLAHQQDYVEWNKFLVDFARQKNALGRRLNAEPDAKDYYEQMVGEMQDAPDGGRVLAPDLWWPAMLHLHVALFDIIQTVECLWRHFELTDFDYFNSLNDEWNSYRDNMGLSASSKD